jgi:hypothetical protein
MVKNEIKKLKEIANHMKKHDKTFEKWWKYDIKNLGFEPKNKISFYCFYLRGVCDAYDSFIEQKEKKNDNNSYN